MLLRLVFSIYLIVTIAITSFHMYSDYRLEKRKIDTSLDHYQEIFGEPISAALWHLDTEQLNATLNGIKALSSVAGILLVDTNTETLYHSGQAPEASEHALHKEVLAANGLFARSFDIRFSDKLLGTLYLYSSNEIVFESVKYNFLFILINALIKTCILWLLFLWAFKKHLVAALDEFVAKMKATDFDNLNEIPEPQKDSILTKSREFSFVNQVFTSMRRRLRHNKQELDKAKDNLEAQVVQRTKLLVRQQQVMEAMSEQARIGAWEYDLQSKSYYWSPMCREIFAISSHFEPSLKGTLSFLEEDSAKTLEACQARAISEGESWSTQLYATSSKGDALCLASTGEAEIIDGECVRIYGAFQDITQAVEAAEALQNAKDRAEAADAIKTNILTGLSHEIRTPMNGIIGMLHVLQSSSLQGPQQSQAQTALDSANALMALLDDLLELSDLKAGNIEVENTRLNLVTLLQEALAAWQQDASKKQLKLLLNVDELAQHEIYADAKLLRHLLSKLLSNAVKFSQQGEVSIAARIGTEPKHDGLTEILVLSVSDQGCGIDATKYDEIFESFSKVATDDSNENYGPGLGLSIAGHIVELLKGRIVVHSEKGKGSLFEIYLPLQAEPTESEQLSHTEADNTPAVNTEHRESTKAEHPSEAEARVLIVEDNPINQMVAQAMLSQLNIASDIANDGEQALEMLRNNAEHMQTGQTLVPDNQGHYYAMALMDCLMPGMDGYTATEHIRAGVAGAYYKQLPIVAMTANAMKGDREKCLQVGMDDYLAKPVSPEALQDALKQWFSQ